MPDGTIRRRAVCDCNAGFYNKDGKCVPVVHPGASITREYYEDAVRDRDRLRDLADKLQAKITEVQRWRRDLRADAQEWADLRRDAAAGVFSDILSAIPAEALAPHIAQAGLAARIPDFETKFMAAFNAVKGLVGVTEGVIGMRQPDAERMKLIAEGNLSLTKAMQLVPDTPANAKTRRILAGANAMLEIVVKGIAHSQRQPTKDWTLELSAFAELVGEVWGVANPYVGASVAVAKLGVRGAQAYVATSAMNDLAPVLNANFNAEVFLRAKLERTNGFIVEQNRLINLYESANPGAKR
ncbi:MAG: hypothetical protein KIT67_14170 [Alphaproteobacteria bacterium]|nr:hypothetical protein [Alphaproteobacteria bacterium]